MMDAARSGRVVFGEHVRLRIVFAVLGVFASVPVLAQDQGDRKKEIVNMVRQDCGSCHGLTMKGGLGPALLPSVLADKDDEQMLTVILDGRRGTPMPPWRPFLSEPEARFVLELLKRGLPDAH